MEETNISIVDADPIDPAEETPDERASREWDEQIARDARDGKLDSLIEEARKDYEAGHYWDVTEKGLFRRS